MVQITTLDASNSLSTVVSPPAASPQCRRGQSSCGLLNPWCRVEKLTGLQLVKKFPAFHGTRKFITALTSVRHLSLSRASRIQSIYPHPTSWRSILILSTHLRLGLPSGLFPSGFPTKTLYALVASQVITSGIRENRIATPQEM